MTKEKYLTYLKQFSNGDEHYADLYVDNVVYRGKPFGLLRGRQAIINSYRDIHRKLRETLTAGDVIIDNEHGLMSAELSNRLVALEDGVKLPSHTMNRDDVFVMRGVVVYSLAKGRITEIREPVEGNTFTPADK
jgi:hypothetical protein